MLCIHAVAFLFFVYTEKKAKENNSKSPHLDSNHNLSICISCEAQHIDNIPKTGIYIIFIGYRWRRSIHIIIYTLYIVNINQSHASSPT